MEKEDHLSQILRSFSLAPRMSSSGIIQLQYPFWSDHTPSLNLNVAGIFMTPVVGIRQAVLPNESFPDLNCQVLVTWWMLPHSMRRVGLIDSFGLEDSPTKKSQDFSFHHIFVLEK